MMQPLSAIRERRTKLGWTQKELAERSGVAQSTVTKIEKGTVRPSYSIVVRIFNALDEGELKKYKGKKAKDLMNPNVITIAPRDRVKRARELMKEHGISQIPVVDKNKVVGMITETDILNGYEDYDAAISDFLVEDVMGAPPLAVRKSTHISAVIELLKQEQALIVVENEKLLGIITRADIIYKG